MLCFVMPQVFLFIKIQPRTALVMYFYAVQEVKAILYRANMVRTVSVRVSDDLYARINKLLEHTCFNLSLLIRLYLVHLTSYFESVISVEEFADAAKEVARTNNFFDSNNMM